MGHDPGGFRVWWRALTGSDDTLENTYLMRMAGRLSRRIRGYVEPKSRTVGFFMDGNRTGEQVSKVGDNAKRGIETAVGTITDVAGKAQTAAVRAGGTMRDAAIDTAKQVGDAGPGFIASRAFAPPKRGLIWLRYWALGSLADIPLTFGR